MSNYLVIKTLKDCIHNVGDRVKHVVHTNTHGTIVEIKWDKDVEPDMDENEIWCGVKWDHGEWVGNEHESSLLPIT